MNAKKIVSAAVSMIALISLAACGSAAAAEKNSTGSGKYDKATCANNVFKMFDAKLGGVTKPMPTKGCDKLSYKDLNDVLNQVADSVAKRVINN